MCWLILSEFLLILQIALLCRKWAAKKGHKDKERIQLKTNHTCKYSKATQIGNHQFCYSQTLPSQFSLNTSRQQTNKRPPEVKQHGMIGTLILISWVIFIN